MKKILQEVDISSIDNDVRYVPGSSTSFCGIAHESRYYWVFTKYDIKDKIILDFGCGSGYGAYLLSKKAKMVYGIDYSRQAIKYAKSKYQKENLRFFVANACSKEEVFQIMDKNSIDIICSFDVIEHLEKYFDYLENICSLLKKNGFLIIGCPNRLQLFEWNRNWNRYHFQEFSPYQLKKILELYFNDVVLVEQDFRDPLKREAIRISRCGKDSDKIKSLIISMLPRFLKNILKRIYKKFRSKGKLDINISDIEFKVLRQDSEDLKRAFGLIAICKNAKKVGRNR